MKVLISENEKLIHSDFKKLTKKLMRAQIITDGKRVDGRDLDEVRKISALQEFYQKECTVQLYFRETYSSFIHNYTWSLK